MALDFNKPIVTQEQDMAQVYHVYQDYMNGAYFNDAKDIWVPMQWTLSGYSLTTNQRRKDLVNYDGQDY